MDFDFFCHFCAFFLVMCIFYHNIDSLLKRLNIKDESFSNPTDSGVSLLRDACSTRVFTHCILLKAAQREENVFHISKE